LARANCKVVLVLRFPGEHALDARQDRCGSRCRRFVLSVELAINQWRWHHNQIRPHPSLRNQTPAAFKKLCISTTKPGGVFQQ